MITTIISGVITIVVITVLLVAVLLFVKIKLTPAGKVKIDINGGKKVIEVTPGSSLLNTLAEQKIFLSSACGGKGSCGQCKCQVLEGGGTILPTEVGFFNRKQINDHWRLGCQVKVKEDLKIQIAESALSVKKWECEVVSNHNVSTFIKEFVVKLPEGEHLHFRPGGYIQVDVPAVTVDYRNIDVDEQYREDWEKMGAFDLRMVNTTPTIRAYSMACYPAEGDIIKLNVRIATPPVDRATRKFLPVNPGICSSYIYSLKPGDKLVVRLTVRADRALEYVQLKDGRAACLEPVSVRSGYRFASSGGYYMEVDDAATNFFFDRLGKGVHVLEYSCRVVRSGRYQTGIATVLSVYAPQFTAHSAGGKIRVGD